MATCPKCGSYLGRNHSCWGVRQRVALLMMALIGGAVGFVIPWFLVDRPAGPLLAITALLGSVLALAVRRYARF